MAPDDPRTALRIAETLAEIPVVPRPDDSAPPRRQGSAVWRVDGARVAEFSWQWHDDGRGNRTFTLWGVDARGSLAAVDVIGELLGGGLDRMRESLGLGDGPYGVHVAFPCWGERHAGLAPDGDENLHEGEPVPPSVFGYQFAGRPDNSSPYFGAVIGYGGAPGQKTVVFVQSLTHEDRRATLRRNGPHPPAGIYHARGLGVEVIARDEGGRSPHRALG